MTTFGFVFARGGSKGLPGKNVKPLCGKPLIAHAIGAMRDSGCIDRIFVSTDSPEIAAVAREYGAEVPFLRPAELAGDASPERLSWKHAIRFLQDRGDGFDLFVAAPATAPLRRPEDIRRCVDAFRAGGCDFAVTCAESARSPYFNMVTLDARGLARLAMPLVPPPVRRQDAPKVYEVVPVAYVSTPAHLLATDTIWEGRLKAVPVDRESAVDIDDETDFALAEWFMERRGARP